MIIINSIKQMFRTPIKMILFLILFSLSAMLVALGGNLWNCSQENQRRFSDIFSTIGTVEQRSTNMNREEIWDAGLQTYYYKNIAEYQSIKDIGVLAFDGAGYLSGPERRPYYAAYVPDYKIMDDGTGRTNNALVEASPVEDCIPAGPVKMRLEKVLYSYYPFNMPYFYYCDHNNPNPEMLYADKTYIINMGEALPHGWFPGTNNTDGYEYIPFRGIYTSQTDDKGTLIENQLPNLSIEEVTENFYQTEHGQMWLALVEESNMLNHTVPVTPTNDINLIMSFFTEDSYLSEGKGFSQEEYQSGDRVCLIPRAFARRNHLSVQDTICLPLRYANYAHSASIGMGFGPLNAEGEAYSTFDNGTYKIIGIYDLSPGASKNSGYALADNEIIIPAASVKNSDQANIACFGPLKGYTTSFQIPNGTIDEFMTIWNQTGNPDLEINFYDKGYSKLEAGLLNMKKMSFVLLGAGIMTAVLILFFFCNMLITKQKRRTAIERSLGLSKSQCMTSLLTAILFIAVMGSLMGSIAGYLLTNKAVESMETIHKFDTRYSDGNTVAELAEKEGEMVLISSEASIKITILSGCSIVVFGILIAAISMNQNLKREPLALLSGREETK